MMLYAARRWPSWCMQRLGHEILKGVLVGVLRVAQVVALLVWVQVVASAQESPPQAADFAYGYMLEVDGDGAIYSLSLPEDVYRNATRADLGDMRVFNSEGQVVPMAVRRRPASVGSAPTVVSLPLFPLYAQGGEMANTMALHITTDAQGAIIDISGQQHEARAHVEAYLLDASQLKQTVRRLRLHWSSAPARFVTRVSVEGSNDLTHWRELVDKVMLVSLAFDARQLRRDEILLPPVREKYLRIQWPAGCKGVVLDAVDAQTSPQVTTVPRHWLPVVGTREQGRRARDYVFDSGGFFPVDRVQIVLPRRNALVRVALASRVSSTQTWQRRFVGMVYHFTVDGAEFNNDAVPVPRVSDRYWRVRLLSPVTGTAPVLLLGWRPDQLLFVAKGEAPFRLAYGGVGIMPDRRGARALFRTLATEHHDDIIKAAQPGNRIELGGVDRLRMPGPPLSWRHWLWWGILVFGVWVSGWMAWRVSRRRR